MARVQQDADCSGAIDDRSAAAILAKAVAELEHLDPVSLRRRWRALVGGASPPDLGRPLTLRVLAYKLQAQQLGDLDKTSLRELSGFTKSQRVRADSVVDPPAAGIIANRRLPCPPSAVQPTTVAPRTARPGTLLTREYGGAVHRVMVFDDGVSWNGTTYESLSKVAFAITGTKWNGPRFFGLRDPMPSQHAVHRSKSAADGKLAVVGRGRTLRTRTPA